MLPFQPIPYTGPLVRHLIYHLWPAAHTDQWQWNLDQILKRIDVFTGRRIIGVAIDNKSVPFSEVRKYVDGHDIELFEVHNAARLGELTTFGRMLESLRTDDPNEIIFYAHGKGTRYPVGEAFHPPNKCKTTLIGIRKWAAVMYAACLDDIDLVDDALESHMFAGSLRRFDGPGWHYTGTFYWMRSVAVFARQQEIVLRRQRWSTEFWPLTICPAEHSYCLYGDHVGHLYDVKNLDEVIARESRVLDLDIPEPKEGVIQPGFQSIDLRSLIPDTSKIVTEFAKNLTKYGIAKARWVAAGCPKVPDMEKRLRLAVCSTCEHRDGRNCGLCNCFLPDKAEMATEICPELRWDHPELRQIAFESIEQKKPGGTLPAQMAISQP